jgi:hypothetical protein
MVQMQTVGNSEARRPTNKFNFIGAVRASDTVLPTVCPLLFRFVQTQLVLLVTLLQVSVTLVVRLVQYVQTKLKLERPGLAGLLQVPSLPIADSHCSFFAVSQAVIGESETRRIIEMRFAVNVVGSRTELGT